MLQAFYQVQVTILRCCALKSNSSQDQLKINHYTDNQAILVVFFFNLAIKTHNNNNEYFQSWKYQNILINTVLTFLTLNLIAFNTLLLLL